MLEKKIKLEGFSNYVIYPELGMVWSKPRPKSKGGWIGNKQKSGYWRAGLVDDEGKVHTFPLHRLIWQAVKGDIPEGLEVNHIDEDKDNNSIFNLNLMTRKENVNWGTRNQRSAEKLKNHPNESKQVGAFKDGVLVMIYPSTQEAGRNGFNQGHIAACCKGKRKIHKGYEWQYLN